MMMKAQKSGIVVEETVREINERKNRETNFLIFNAPEPKTNLKSQVSSGLLQTAQTWANAGVCGGLCACAVGGTFD